MGVDAPTAIVLSGGGARGAYEAGVMAGLVEVLGLNATDRAPFQVFTGTSVGAINVAFMAANADRGDMAVTELVRIWSDLKLGTHLRFDPLGFLGVRQRFDRLLGRGNADAHGGSILDMRALEAVVRDNIGWDRLHTNVAEGTVSALVVAALGVAGGRTHLFAETAPGCDFRPSKDPRRVGIDARITAEHVLASAAIPFVFPARKVDGAWFCDGGIRFNTPIAPAIRSGAERLVVVSLRHGEGPPPAPAKHGPYPGPVVLLGKVLNALLLDPVTYDLQVLDRFNQMLGVLDDALEAPERARVDEVTAAARGQPYRQLETLVFSPSQDLGRIAGDHLRGREPGFELGRIGRTVMRRAASESATWEVDLASYVLFDGSYAQKLMEVGHRDVWARADDVRAFFDP